MPKKISFDNYLKRRGLKAHTVKTVLTTPTGKLASEYFELLKLTAESPLKGVQAFFGKSRRIKTNVKIIYFPFCACRWKQGNIRKK